MQGGAIRGPSLPKTFKGFIFPKIRPALVISSLNKSVNNFSMVRASSAQISSVGATCQKKVDNTNEIIENSFQAALFSKKQFVMDFKINTLLNNFSTIERISAGSIPVD
jgi:hypothetical protein